MYEFIDVNEASEGALLPSEALQINGEFIENLIKGYRTLSVTGREALSPELETTETGNRDGSELKYKRYPARTITVKYQLITETAEEFREAYNKLADILNVQDAELIFNDETDKYFTGTPSRIGEVKAGVNTVVSEFDLLCLDPFKYSVTEYEAEATLDGNSILIDYGGTYKSFPKLEANFYRDETAANNDGDCGYVAFFNENEDIIQLGDPEEENIGNYEKSQTLVSSYFKTTSDWNDQTEQEWAENAGFVLPSSVEQQGSAGIVPATYEEFDEGETSGTLLTKESTQAKPNIKYTVTAKTSGRKEDRINVKVTVAAYVEGVAKTTKQTTGIKAGMSIYINNYNTSIYLASDSSKAEGTLRKGLTLYLWDASVKNGRIRITSQKSYVGVSGQVTGWVKLSDVGLSVSTKTTTTITGLDKVYGLKAAIQIGSNSWEYVTLKEENISWAGNATYTKTLDITVKDLAADTTEIEDIKFKVERTDSKDDKVGIIEETDCTDLEISSFIERVPETYCLGATDYGVSNTKWHGATITKLLPADAAGEIGAQNFTLTYSARFKEDENEEGLNQYGANQLQITAADGSHIFGIRIYKNAVGRKYSADFYVNGKNYATWALTAVGNITITKLGKKISYTIGKTSGSVNSSGVESKKAAKITFAFEQYANKPALTYNGLYWVSFTKNNCETFKEIPNKFTTNDVLEADCGTGEILLNGVPSAALGALGNDWEKFYLKKGVNQLGFAYSEWVKAGCEPSFKIRYREVFL